MLLLTQDQRARLIANGQSRGDHVPVVKFFNPVGAATWLFSELDEDGDYKMVMALDGGRTQMVFIRSGVETYGRHRVREIWSPAYRVDAGAFPGPVANRLLEASDALKLGAWVNNAGFAVLVVKVDAGIDAEALDQAIGAAVTSADEMERELAGDPDSDEF